MRRTKQRRVKERNREQLLISKELVLEKVEKKTTTPMTMKKKNTHNYKRIKRGREKNIHKI